MRIIAGKYKNKSIEAPDGSETRPTKDMVKEALFSSLGIFNGDEVFLDLFGGSGSVGLEALSRGAKKVYINDISLKAYNVIKKNASGFEGDIRISNMNYETLLNNVKDRFDYIFIDPPYKFDEYTEILGMISSNEILKEDGIIIFETAKETVLDENYGNLEVYKDRRYGISKLHYIRRKR